MAYGRNTPTIGGSADLNRTNIQSGYVIAYDLATKTHKYVPQGADPTTDNRLTALEETYVRSTRFATITTTTGTVTIPEDSEIILNDFGGEIDCDIQSISEGRPNGEAAFDTDGEVLISTFNASGEFELSGTPAAASVALVYRVRQQFIDYDDTDSDIIGKSDKEMPEYYRVNLTAADSPYSPPSVKNYIFAVDLFVGDVVINLPEVSPLVEGDSCYIYIERINGTAELTINTYGAQTIRGATSQVLRVLRDGVHLIAHTFLTDHWDVFDWSRTDEIIYNPGNAGTTSIKTLQGLLNHTLSSGQISGCVVSSNGNGTIAVTAGEWKLRIDDTASGDCRIYAIPAAASLTPTNKATSYLTVNYNSGTPSWTIETDITTIACRSKCVQAVIYRRDNAIHWTYLGEYSTDFMAAYARAKATTAWLEYGGGLAVSNPATRRLATTAGALYQGTIRFAIPAFNTNASDTMNLWYRDGAGDWTVVTGQTDLGNTQYDDGDGTLANLSANRYANWWVFTLVDNPSTLVAVYPQTQHTSIANARAEAIPAVLPPWAAKFSIGKLIAKVMVQQGTATVVEISSPFTQAFTSATPVSHNDLAGLQGGEAAQYYHLTQAQHTIATQAASDTVAGYIDTGAQTIAGVKTFNTSVVINETGADSDTRVEGDTDANLIYCDAGNNRVGIGTATPAEKLEVNGNIKATDLTVTGFASLGEGPKIKMKKLTGTTASAQNGVTEITHGLTAGKILAVVVQVEFATNSRVPPSYAYSAGYEFFYYYDATLLRIYNSTSNSANILSKPLTILITYEE
jgi:hypothetical protein